MCPGLDHPAFPLIPERVSHSISSWQRSPLPSALLPHTFFLQLLQRCVCSSPITSTVTQDAHSQFSCLHLYARPPIVQGPFFRHVPATPVPWRLASSEAAYDPALPVSFPLHRVPLGTQADSGVLSEIPWFVFFSPPLRDKRQIGHLMVLARSHCVWTPQLSQARLWYYLLGFSGDYPDHSCSE